MKVIVVEGCRGVGKTSFSNDLRDRIPYSSLLKLCGLPKTANQREEIAEYHNSFMRLVKSLSHLPITVIMDRSFLTERVMASLYKDYNFSAESMEMLRSIKRLGIDIDFVLLVNDKESLGSRLEREKVRYLDLPYLVESSLNEQELYLKIWEELEADGFSTKIIKTDKPVNELTINYMMEEDIPWVNKQNIIVK